MVWTLCPASNWRTLEGTNLVFASDSIWDWEAEREFKLLKEQLVQAAARGRSAVDEESGAKRGCSLAVAGLG